MWSKCLLAKRFSSKRIINVFYHWCVCSPAVPSLLAEIPLRQKLRYIETKSARRCTGIIYFTWALKLPKHLYEDIHIFYQHSVLVKWLFNQSTADQKTVPQLCDTNVCWPNGLCSNEYVTVFYPWRVCSPAVPSLPGGNTLEAKAQICRN